ncbi:3-dehydroquinate dehydratase 1 [invertebrate metagenome]|uniref:3-dehydroquinate dehydratase n=1 Tax=invertebrate metagenome TaxID=1711999 RepID=A0A2H9T980_9ZZZZ
MATILVLNGPNLNLLGARETDIYGKTTLDQITQHLTKLAQQHKHALTHFQSNAEHCLIDRIQKASRESIKFILFNPAAFTHTSIAIRDALLAVNIPFIEIHLSNVYSRESFRHRSYFSDIARGTISGLGSKGYELALLAAIDAMA